jgi:acetyl esterase/lipase
MGRTLLIAALGITLATGSARAQQVVNIWPGVAPGSEHWTQKERTIENTPVGTVIMNVVTPTLTAYLPPRGKATGTGVIIAPGGAFVALAITLEATDMARWLQQRGIAAFVLKYRTVEKKTDGIPDMDMDTAGRYGIADGIQALKVVRRHAAEWGVSPDRIGFAGFSAGGMVAAETLLPNDVSGRPNFAALIYGAPFGKMPAIPAKVPPIFMAWAQDDQVALAPIIKFHDALVAAGQMPEAHIFSAGGHGFGTTKHGTTSDHWLDEFYYWLEAQGFAPHSTVNEAR